MIEVRFKVTEAPMRDGPEAYFDWLEKKLKDAGIPVEGDAVLTGALHILHDPDDWGSTIYRWTPNL